MPRALLGFQSANRAENLCYQLKQGQKLLPQFRKIVCLVGAPDGWIPTVTSFPRNDTGETPTPERKLIQGVLINVMCNFKDGTRAARRRALERRAFVAHKLLLPQPQQVVVVRLGSLCSSSHTTKNFAFIFDIQALVRLFLPSGSPCVRSTSDCAVLMATPGAQSAVARLSADLYCKHPVCRSLFATN